jgi:hypothetical protein
MGSRDGRRGRDPAAGRWDPRLEEGVKRVRAGGTLAEAARDARTTQARMAAYLAATGVARQEGGRWTVGPDRRPRAVVLYSRGRAVEVVVGGYDEARLVGEYMNAVARLQEVNDPSPLAPFRGRGVTDARGRSHPFETDPAELYRLMAAGPEPFEQVYRIVVT